MSDFSFENLSYLFLLLFIPLIYFLYKKFYKGSKIFNDAASIFADKELLPHLVKNKSFFTSQKSKILFWSLLWFLAVLTFSGPRFGYKEVKTYDDNKNLVILLDLSSSMDASDVKPNRLTRAKQEISDILEQKDSNLKIALIGFSSIPHLISPLTFDDKTISNLLPYIDNDLVSLEGANLSKAINMAIKLIEGVDSKSNSILVMTDGGFDNYDIKDIKGIKLSFMGFGTREGAPVPNQNGNFKKKNGKIVIDKLQDDRMEKITANGGEYFHANYLGHDTESILENIEQDISNKKDGKIVYWNEIFYVPLALLMLLVIFCFRSGFFLSLAFIFIFFTDEARANIFLNDQQKAFKHYQSHEYQKAAEGFSDSYQKGVSYYRAKDYKNSQKSFQNLNDAKSQYNLGNALFQQKKFNEAIKAYENAIRLNSKDKDAKHNLELAKKMLKQQQKQKNKNDNKGKKGDDKKDSSKNNNDDGSNSDSSKGKQKNNSSGEEDKNNKSESSKSENQNKDKQQQNKSGKESKKENSTKDNLNKNSANKNSQKKKSDDVNSANSKQNKQNQKRDFNANMQLDRIKSNPANILKNQFYIEEQQYLLEKKK